MPFICIDVQCTRDYFFRTLPRAVLIGVPMVTIIYILANISYLTLLSPTELMTSKAVAIDWGKNLVKGSDSFGVAIPWVMTSFVAMSTFGAASGSLFSSGRQGN